MMTAGRMKQFVVIAALVLAGGAPSVPLTIQAATANDVTPGEFVIEPPTLINLGFEWFIQGDDNRNASVAVSYRKQGASQWTAAMPLLRLQGERIYGSVRVDVMSRQHVRRQRPRPRTRHGLRRAVRDVRSRRRPRRGAEDR